MMTTVQEYTATLVVEECCTCHMDFGVTRSFQRERRNDHAWFYCPVGHPQRYSGKSDLERTKAELEAARKIAENERDWRRREQADRKRAERQRSAARGQITKIKRRVGHGVCPCCSRSFTDLARHMAGQHPEYADGGADA